MSDLDELEEELTRWRWCRACDVKWWGDPECWVCEKPTGPMYPFASARIVAGRTPEGDDD